jgi:7-cyano-7-deazaguanine synthase
MTKVAFVLLSGGIDSSTCLAIAHEEFDQVEGVSIDYGQRHSKELEYAKRQCDSLGVNHHVISLRDIVPKTMLTDPNVEIPAVSYDEIKGVSPTYVPFRNGLMLSALASYVTGKLGDLEEWGIYFGAHAEDAQNWAYPDCTPEFIGAMANAIYIGTYRSVRLHTPLQWLTKDQIIVQGSKLGVNWVNTWSCYAGNKLHCGVCPTCRARRLAFFRAAIYDPTIYDNDDEF